MIKKITTHLIKRLSNRENNYFLLSNLFFFQIKSGLPYRQALTFTLSDEPRHRIIQMVVLLAVVLSLGFVNTLFRSIIRIIRQDRAANQKKKALEDKKNKNNQEADKSDK